MIRTDDARKDAKTMKIVFCGPPHSGKSVFLQGLTANTPHDDYYLFRACPDGEGTWTYSNSAAAAMRRKGSFTPEQVSWYVDKLRACDLAPVILVDVGGRMTEENRRIMSQCDRAVTASGTYVGEHTRCATWDEEEGLGKPTTGHGLTAETVEPEPPRTAVQEPGKKNETEAAAQARRGLKP